MDYKCNSDYKTAKGMPFNLGDCSACRHNNVCKYKEDREKIINNIEDTLDNLQHETPISIEVMCRQFRVDLG